MNRGKLHLFTSNIKQSKNNHRNKNISSYLDIFTAIDTALYDQHMSQVIGKTSAQRFNCIRVILL